MRRILVVDDDRDALISITNVLRAEYPHLEVRVAANAAAARTLADAETFDLVLANDRLAPSLGMPSVAVRRPIEPDDLLALVQNGSGTPPARADG